MLFAAFLSPLYAAENWIRLDTAHFEMYTTNGQKQATAALQIFEQVRSFFLERSVSKSVPATPVRVIAFRSEKEYRPYRLNEGAFAYYTRSRKVDYIVMQDIDATHYHAAVHEYTHLIVEHLKLNLPIWLNEGTADLYSTLEAEGKKTIVGKPIPEDVAILRSQQWLPLNTLFSVDHDSPYYNQRDKMQIFYAESWALTHMLTLGKAYIANFPKFLAAVSARRPIADCFETVYGKSIAQVDADLHAYLQQAAVQVSVFDSKLEKPDLEPDVAPASDPSLNLALADLLACNPKYMPEAMTRLSKLAVDDPASPDVQESLAYLLWQQGDPSRAREHFQLAAEKGSHNPEMLFHYSQLLLESGGPKDEVMNLLVRATALKPAYDDALYTLGMLDMETGKWSAALANLSQIKTVSPDRAFSLFSALAFSNWKLNAPDPARVMADRARQYARDPDEISRATKLQEMLANKPPNPAGQSGPSLSESAPPDAPERPTLLHRPLAPDEPTIRMPNLQHVEAVAKFFTCDPKTPLLRVIVQSHEMTFIIANPASVIVRNSPNGTVDFSCGAQKSTKLGIFYTPPTPGTKADGSIVELVF